MPKINRSKTTYAKLPETMRTKSMTDAKLSLSLNVLVPKRFEKKAEKFMDEVHRYVASEFKSFMKKEIKKAQEKDEESGKEDD